MLFNSLILVLVMVVVFIGCILHFARLTTGNEMTHPALAIATVVMGFLLTLLIHSLWQLTLSQFATVMAGSEALMWILLLSTTKRFIRLFYPDIVFTSWFNFKIVAFGRQRIYGSGLLDDLLD